MKTNNITLQTIITKLDLNAITLKDAKAFSRRFGYKADGRTKQQFIKNLTKEIQNETITN